MKKSLVVLLLCVFLSATCLSVRPTLCSFNEHIDFFYSGMQFCYNLDENIPNSNQFDLSYKINRHKRFSSPQNRTTLLKQMLSLGFDKSVCVEYLFPNILKKIEQIENVVNKTPKNATLSVNPNSEKVFFITKQIEGRIVDKNQLLNDIIEKYQSKKPLTIQVKTITLTPEIKQEDFEKFSHKRGDFSTSISSSSADRKHNVKNALVRLNKQEIYPNQVFSFNKIIGKRTKENGYRKAKIIMDNEFVNGIGGGVCQVSSTLYNTALLAGLEIVEANKHSKQVGYVKYGFDAMVNFGTSDLKFRNNTQEKLTIITNYSDSTARIRIFGESMHGISYKLENQIISSTPAKEEVLIDTSGKYKEKVVFEDEYFYLKKPTNGMEIKSYRKKMKDGECLSIELLRFDKFKVQDAIKVVGAKKRSDEQSVA